LTSASTSSSSGSSISLKSLEDPSNSPKIGVLQRQQQPPPPPPQHEEESDEVEQPTWKGFLYLIAGGALIYFFSEPFIKLVVSLGKSIKMHTIVLAFFFAPVASEAPEILESISLSRKGKAQNINIAFSNLVGGTISKTTLFVGLLNFYATTKQFEWVSPSFTMSIALLIVCAAFVSMFSLEVEHKAIKGYIMIGLFVLCAIAQFAMTYWQLVEPVGSV
jgi:Ca2+/Na+ antiporter